MNILCYLEAVTHPKDFSTIGLELNFSDPAKSDPNLENLRYQATDQFIADVRPVFNCIKSNGPDHAISQMGMRAEFNDLPHYLTLGARGPGNQQKHLEYIAGSG